MQQYKRNLDARFENSVSKYTVSSQALPNKQNVKGISFEVGSIFKTNIKLKETILLKKYFKNIGVTI